MKRHLWTTWRGGVERCSRPGCKALRKHLHQRGRKDRPKQLKRYGRRYQPVPEGSPLDWSPTVPPCTGTTTAD